MNKTGLALLICALLSAPAFAQNSVTHEQAWEGTSYLSVIVKLKPGTTLNKSSPFSLRDSTLAVSPLFTANHLRSSELSEMDALNERYGFNRYLRIALPADKQHDAAYINDVINELTARQDIELAYPESMPVSLEKGVNVPDVPPYSGLSYALNSTSQATVPDFRGLQDYTKSPDEKRPGYYMGGVNRDSVNQYTGHDGSGISLVSMENNAWNTSHVNLPPIEFHEGDKRYTPGEDHDTSSVGIMAAKDINAGIKGLTWNARMGYVKWQANNLYNMIPRLKAGDVVQIGMQTGGGDVTGCTSSCYVPQENAPAYYDVIKALTDKGVHVIQAAGNGNINLDHAGFNGKFDVKKRDSGAIIAGAFCADNGKKASFSTYGSRVTSASWGCWDVVTTGYGGLHSIKNAEYTSSFSGTSSANPIIAGVVASLSAIAKAHNITVTPQQKRSILQETGTPLAAGDSAKVGTHPNMAKAVARILELKEEEQEEVKAVPGESFTVTGTTDSSRAYQLDGSASKNAVSWKWTIDKNSTGTFWLQEKHAGGWVREVSGPTARALIPANTDGEATYWLTVTGKDGSVSAEKITVTVKKPQLPDIPDDSAEAYNPRIAYPVKCTRVSHNGKIWLNQWYVNAGQEEPGSGGEWGAWRTSDAANNSCP